MVREEGLLLVLSLLNNRQRRYGYRLLTAPRSQPTRDIRSVTLCKEEKHAHPGELVERDDNLFRPMCRGKETLRQCLMRAIA